MEDDKIVEAPEDVAAEKDALVLPKEEDVRAKIIEELGFDETTDAEKIDKLVAKEMGHAKKLSSAIGAKIKYRDKAAKPKDDKAPKDNKGDDKDSEITSKDVLVLTGAGVKEEEDVDAVVEYARFKGIPISEALKTPYIKSTLAEKAENRKVAEASNTTAARRGTGKMSDEEVVDRAAKGEDVDAETLAAARMNLKKAGKR